MMNFNFTEEEIEALKYYKNIQYKAINQLLVSNCETDIALLSEEINADSVQISYDRENVAKNMGVIKKIYEFMQKAYYQKNAAEGWAFARGTNIAEIDRLKNELYIDKFLSTTSDSQKAEKEFCSVWSRPAIMYICGNSNIPYIKMDEVLGKQDDNAEVIISPFTKIKEISEGEEIRIENSGKTIKTYHVKLEKQELEELSEQERMGLYHYIVDNANSVNRRLQECLALEKENAVHYENMRKLEQLLSKYELTAERKENEKDYPETERRADLDDIERINKELNELKEVASEIYQIRKGHIDFVTNWKRNIAVYLMAECREIELKYIAISEVREEKENEKIEQYKEEIKVAAEMVENKNYEEVYEIVKKECEENKEISNLLLENIEKLISKQQNYAKIARNLGTDYSALANAFEMKKNTESLKDLIQTIHLKVESINEQEDKTEQIDKLKTISDVNIQISTLMNYLNNPKIAIQSQNINRFDEISIIEENELKRGIATRIREICGEAELKKLKDDLELLEDKSAISKFFGIFTGRNKLDEFMIEQIGIRKNAIRRTLSKRMTLTHSYSIHELIAEIRMFVEENDSDELVEDFVGDLEALEEELKRNFIVIDSKVRDIVEQKEGRNLPVNDKKLGKMELIEIETYQCLHKYGYDIMNVEEDPEYQNTIASEISKIVEYIKTSNVLNL